VQVEPWLTRAARRRADHIAVETPERSLTYRQLDRLAGAGAGELGVAPGSRVAIALAPGVDFVVALHACLRAGAVAVPIDLREPSPLEGRPYDAVIDEPLRCVGPAVAAGPHELDSVALLVRTSGTSARPREVPLTYGNFLWSAIGSAVALGSDPADRWLCTLPLVHVGGLSIVLRSAIYATTAVIHERFSADEVVGALMERDISLVSVVATTLRRLLDAGLAAPPALRCALAGGGPVPEALIERAREARVVVSQTYGLTEACSQVATQRPGEGAPNCGPPLFCTRVRVSEDGEILVSGPTVSPGVDGGLLATGDLGSIAADGSLTVIGRRSETIVSGGENVAPAEVEAVLEQHPAVIEAGVYGARDERWGEAVHAVVVTRSPVVAAELLAHCRSRLPGFKVPKRVDFVASLPRTASGKLQRFALGVDDDRTRS
jgi:O-succinylbenzoic acid--CoA ligase